MRGTKQTRQAKLTTRIISSLVQLFLSRLWPLINLIIFTCVENGCPNRKSHIPHQRVSFRQVAGWARADLNFKQLRGQKSLPEKCLTDDWAHQHDGLKQNEPSYLSEIIPKTFSFRKQQTDRFFSAGGQMRDGDNRKQSPLLPGYDVVVKKKHFLRFNFHIFLFFKITLKK